MAVTTPVPAQLPISLPPTRATAPNIPRTTQDCVHIKQFGQDSEMDLD